jgi:hypothetical protein
MPHLMKYFSILTAVITILTLQHHCFHHRTNGIILHNILKGVTQIVIGKGQKSLETMEPGTGYHGVYRL